MLQSRYIKKAQENLMEAGYNVGAGGADGIFGAGTLKAVNDAIEEAVLQREAEDADIQQAAGNFIFARLLKYGDRGEDVKNLQELLINWHMACYLGKAGADGIYGRGTQEAVEEMQKGMSHKITGSADIELLDMLKGEPIDISRWINEQTDGTMPMECNCAGRYCDSFENAQPGKTSVGLLILIERIQAELNKRFGREDIELHLTDDMNMASATDRNGGNRCETWNSLHGGAKNSQHIHCRAADLFVVCPDIEGLKKPAVGDLYAVANEMNPYGGVGKYAGNIHVDTRGYRGRW
ncbi:MAG: peptidoglycan-binding protein [Clostridia bacterium]|nr:peptidoglycan-binding protein [Clostridia bacterium]